MFSGAAMLFSRRRLFAALGLPFIAVPLVKLLAQDPVTSRRRPDGSQDASSGEGATPGTFPPNANKSMLEERQKNIRRDVEKLYNLASQLKSEVDKTDSTTVLSVAMLKKAEEIEKLARQIKDRAKG
jgi:hypothetical protein